MNIIENLQQKASLLNNLKKNETALFEFINSNHNHLEEVINQYKPEIDFSPVNTLRFLIANELQKGTEVNNNLIDKLKQALENRDVSAYYVLNDSVNQGLLNYKKSKIGMFPNWKYSFNILFPFLHNTSDNYEIKTQLNQLADEIISVNNLENVTKHIVNFQGSNNYGTDRIWLAILPESAPSVQYAYQIFLNIDKDGLLGGIHKGHNLTKQEFNNQDLRYNSWQEYLEHTKTIKEKWLQLNSGINFIFLNDEKEFKKVLKKVHNSSLATYFEMLDRLKEDLDFEDAENLVFSVAKYRLSFQVGKRYCLALVNDKFRFITPASYDLEDFKKESFTAPDNAFLYHNANKYEVVEHYEAIKDAVESEIERDNHTKAKSYDNSALRKTVFDKEYRSRILNELDINSQNKSGMKNLKQEFIEWYITNPQSSYFNNDPHKLSEYLTKSEESFSKDIFLVDFDTYRDMIDFIEETINNNKSKFLKNHGAPDSGKLAAIVGKRNYQKFLKEFFNPKEYIEKDIFSEKINEEKIVPINTIFYGPPGTGKTFKLQSEYFEKFTVFENTLTKEQFLDNLVVDLTWWQTFAIALKDLGTVSTTELLEHQVVKAKERLSTAKNIKPIVWSRLQAHTVEECTNVNVAKRSEPQIFYKEENSKWRINKQTIEELYPEADIFIDQINNYQPSSDRQIYNYEFVTFHQSFSYEDFIEGIKPKLGEEESDVSYEIQDGIFKKLCLKADADRENNYAIFIDEINRGNVSAIFGELITLIEKDKRLGEVNELRAKLPYSKKELGVPPNLYIFGTMNTADRSVEALDTALRRRFSFEEVMPLPTLLKHIEFEDFDLSQVLSVINDRVEALLDRDHTIGHSYFMNIESGDVENLKQAFENKIIPLLQEYFYHDYEKLALILGEGFVAHKDSNIKFAKFKNIDQPEINSSFELKNINDIQEAVQILLNLKDEKSE